MQFGEILSGIRNGDFDENLLDFQHALVARQEVRGKIMFANLKVGDTGWFNDNVKAKLRGQPITVVAKRRTKVLIRTEDGTEYVGNPSLLRF